MFLKEGCGSLKIYAHRLYSACGTFPRRGLANNKQRFCMINICKQCNKEQKILAKGLCKKCYYAQYQQPKHKNKCKKCDEIKTILAKSLCRKCYYAEYRKYNTASLRYHKRKFKSDNAYDPKVYLKN